MKCMWTSSVFVSTHSHEVDKPGTITPFTGRSRSGTRLDPWGCLASSHALSWGWGTQKGRESSGNPQIYDTSLP